MVSEHNRLTYTYLFKLKGLLPIQPVSSAESIGVIWLVDGSQQLGKTAVDIFFIILGFQVLQTARENLSVTKTH